jgi:hypothetical protein
MSTERIHREQEAAGIIQYLVLKKIWSVHHRTDGPAVIYEDGTEMWCVGGQLHRLDGPAVIYPAGDEIWYMNGWRHREDGPAEVRADGPEYYYLFNKQYIREDWLEIMERCKRENLDLYWEVGENATER